MTERGHIARAGGSERPYLIRVNPGGFDSWSSERLPFQPRGWKREWRDDLARHVRGLAPAESIRAVYTSRDEAVVDTENVVFYNVGAAAFRHLTRGGLVFERAFEEPPAPPEAVPWPVRHHQQYNVGGQGDSFVHWRVARMLASWSDVELPELTSSLSPSRVWAVMKAASVAKTCEVPQRFGLRIRLRGTRGRPTSASIKPLLDGVISAFHNSDEGIPPLAVQRISEATGVGGDEVVHRLGGQPSALGTRKLVRVTAGGIAWNPRDEGCVACVIEAEPAGEPGMSGELFAVSDADDAATTMRSIAQPRRRWSDDEWTQIQKGTRPRDMDDQWWIIMCGRTMRVHRSWTGKLIFEARFRRDAAGWGIDRAWITGSSSNPGDADMLSRLIDCEVLGLNSESSSSSHATQAVHPETAPD